MEIHIGNIVRKVAGEKGIKPGELARRIGMHSRSMNRMMNRAEMETALLKKLCIALDHDFFRYYSDGLDMGKPEPEKNTTDEKTEMVIRENEELKKENERLKEENGFLREINELLKKSPKPPSIPP